MEGLQCGPWKLFTPTQQVKRFGLPQGLPVSKSCSPLAYHGWILVSLDLCQQGASRVRPQPCTPQSVEASPADEATRSFFSCPEEGSTKTYQSFKNLQKHLDAGKHLVKLERESTYDSVKKKWAFGFCWRGRKMCTRLEIRRELLQCFNWPFSKLGGLGKIF